MRRPSQVAETCQLALQRIEWLKAHPEAGDEESPYYSVDPTPALPTSTPTEELRQVLLDENKRMFDVSAGRRWLLKGGGAKPACVRGRGERGGGQDAEIAVVARRGGGRGRVGRWWFGVKGRRSQEKKHARGTAGVGPILLVCTESAPGLLS